MTKILYALQGTGNGHVARALEIIPILEKYGEVDILLSGDQSQVELPFNIKYKIKGLTFLYSKSGAVSILKTLFKNNLFALLKSIWQLPVLNYSVVINDFEFTSAWACKLKGKRCYGLGHQAAFKYKITPRPTKKDWLGELILKHYAPCNKAVGFHFDAYGKGVYPAVIRKELRDAKTENKGHYCVYLPAYSKARIEKYLKQLASQQWHIFSKEIGEPHTQNNLHFKPICNKAFTESLRTCEGLLTSAGFESPSEALFLNKKLFVIPIALQYEQLCNAAALDKIGVPSAQKLNSKSLASIEEWTANALPLKMNFPNNTETIIVKEILQDLK